MRSRWLPLAVLAATILTTGGLTACSNNAPTDAVDRISINGEEPARGLIPAAADDDAGIKIIDLLFATGEEFCACLESLGCAKIGGYHGL